MQPSRYRGTTWKIIHIVGWIVMMFSPVSLHAETTQMNETLVRLIYQLDAMLPLIDQAKAEQNPAARVQFHFDTWVDATGVTHAGLRQNVLAMRQALVNQINQSDLTPKTIAPIQGDYVGR